MKTYKLSIGEKQYVLSGLVNSVKEDVVDTVQSDERKSIHRQMKKGLIDAAVFESSKASVAAIKFLSGPVLGYIQTIDGVKHLIREQLIEGGKCPEPTSEEIDAIYAAQTVEDSEAALVFKQIWEDAFPKGQKPPPSTTT